MASPCSHGFRNIHDIPSPVAVTRPTLDHHHTIDIIHVYAGLKSSCREISNVHMTEY